MMRPAARKLLTVAALVGAAGAASAAVAPPATADESLTPKEVLAVMVKRRVEIRKLCWEDSKQKADASVRVDFVVAQTGVVTEATPREVSGPPSISECVVAEVKRTTFPTSEKGGRFRWPFIFKGP